MLKKGDLVQLNYTEAAYYYGFTKIQDKSKQKYPIGIVIEVTSFLHVNSRYERERFCDGVVVLWPNNVTYKHDFNELKLVEK